MRKAINVNYFQRENAINEFMYKQLRAETNYNSEQWSFHFLCLITDLERLLSLCTPCTATEIIHLALRNEFQKNQCGQRELSANKNSLTFQKWSFWRPQHKKFNFLLFWRPKYTQTQWLIMQDLKLACEVTNYRSIFIGLAIMASWLQISIGMYYRKWCLNQHSMFWKLVCELAILWWDSWGDTLDEQIFPGV